MPSDKQILVRKTIDYGHHSPPASERRMKDQDKDQLKPMDPGYGSAYMEILDILRHRDRMCDIASAPFFPTMSGFRNGKPAKGCITSKKSRNHYKKV